MRRASCGYIGWSESIRSAMAKECGTYPKTQFKKEYHISEKVFNEIRIAGGFDTEWHHTSKYFNRTDFYKWNETGITMLARMNFTKYQDTIISFLANPDNCIFYNHYYEELWEDDDPCMELIDLVCYFMLEDQDQRRKEREWKRQSYANAEWTLRWAIQNNACVEQFNLRSVLVDYPLYCRVKIGEEVAELKVVDGLYKSVSHICESDEYVELVKKQYSKTFGLLYSMDINEFVRRGEVARMYQKAVSRVLPDEKIHRHAFKSEPNWLMRKYGGTINEEYVLSLYKYYHNETLHF